MYGTELQAASLFLCDFSGGLAMDLSGFLNDIPARYELWVALFIITCKLLTVFVRPPKDGSPWAMPFQMISLLALNIGWAANRLQTGRSKNAMPGKSAKLTQPSDAAGVGLGSANTKS